MPTSIEVILSCITAVAPVAWAITKRCSSFIRNVNSAITDIKAVKSDQELIKAELQHNGGSSIKDAIRRIERSLVLVGQRQVILANLHEHAIFETDANGVCIWVNRQYEVMSGYTLPELRGNEWQTLIHQEDRDMVVEEWDAAIQHKRAFLFNYRWVNAFGKTIHVTCRAIPLRREHDHEVFGWLGIITERQPS